MEDGVFLLALTVLLEARGFSDSLSLQSSAHAPGGVAVEEIEGRTKRSGCMASGASGCGCTVRACLGCGQECVCEPMHM